MRSQEIKLVCILAATWLLQLPATAQDATGAYSSRGGDGMLNSLMRPQASTTPEAIREPTHVQLSDSVGEFSNYDSNRGREYYANSVRYSNREMSVSAVAPAQYQQAARKPTVPSNQLASEHRASFLERAQAEGGGASDLFSSQLGRIALNLMIVLLIAAGAMLFLKQFQKTKSGSARDKQPGQGQFKVIDEMKIGRDTSLTLLQVRGHQVLLARDNAGTKSMQLIPPSFGNSLRERERDWDQEDGGSQLVDEDSPDIDDRLVKLFIDKSRRAA